MQGPAELAGELFREIDSHARSSIDPIFRLKIYVDPTAAEALKELLAQSGYGSCEIIYGATDGIEITGNPYVEANLENMIRETLRGIELALQSAKMISGVVALRYKVDPDVREAVRESLILAGWKTVAFYDALDGEYGIRLSMRPDEV